MGSEAVAIEKALLPIEKEAARQRMIQAHASLGNLPKLDRGRAYDKVASYVGVGRRTLETTANVVESKQEPREVENERERSPERGREGAPVPTGTGLHKAGEETLEGVPPENVPETSEKRPAGTGTSERSGAHAGSRVSNLREPETERKTTKGLPEEGKVGDHESSPGVGTGEGAVATTPERGGRTGTRREPAVQVGRNYEITPEDHLGEGSQKQKYGHKYYFKTIRPNCICL